MNSTACIIPAKISNQYGPEGDLSMFGELTLLEWKISQLKNVFSDKDIYISSISEKIGDIARKNGVNWLTKKTDELKDFFDSFKNIPHENVLIATVTSPFIFPETYAGMLEAYKTLPREFNGLVSVQEYHDYFYFKGSPVNFESHITREKIEPLFKATNGAYLNKKTYFMNNNRYMSETPYLFSIDSFQSHEIRDLENFKVATELVSEYFKKSIK